MTTLHITNAYYPGSGSIRTFYDALLEAANREGRRVVLVVPGRHTETREVGPYGRIHFIRAARGAFDRRYRLIRPHRFLPGLSSALVRILEQEQPGVIEICDKYSLPYLAVMLRKRLASTRSAAGARRPGLRPLRRQRCRLRHAWPSRASIQPLVHSAHLRSAIRCAHRHVGVHGGGAPRGAARPFPRFHQGRAIWSRFRPLCRSAAERGRSRPPAATGGRRYLQRPAVPCRTAGAGKEHRTARQDAWRAGADWPR